MGQDRQSQSPQDGTPADPALAGHEITVMRQLRPGALTGGYIAPMVVDILTCRCGGWRREIFGNNELGVLAAVNSHWHGLRQDFGAGEAH